MYKLARFIARPGHRLHEVRIRKFTVKTGNLAREYAHVLAMMQLIKVESNRLT